MIDASTGPHPQQYVREHYDRILAVYLKLSPRVGQLAAMQAAMEEHDRMRDAAAEGSKKKASGQRREERRA